MLPSSYSVDPPSSETPPYLSVSFGVISPVPPPFPSIFISLHFIHFSLFLSIHLLSFLSSFIHSISCSLFPSMHLIPFLCFFSLHTSLPSSIFACLPCFYLSFLTFFPPSVPLLLTCCLSSHHQHDHIPVRRMATHPRCPSQPPLVTPSPLPTPHHPSRSLGSITPPSSRPPLPISLSPSLSLILSSFLPP